MFTSHRTHSLCARRALALTLALGASLGACAANEDEILATDGESAELGVAQQALVEEGWTRYTTDGSPPIECSGNGLMNGFGSVGKYSDDIHIRCSASPNPRMVRGESTWSKYFSEEGFNSQFCRPGWFITGIACTGDYCDNISIRCTHMVSEPYASPPQCHWTGAFSEEQGPMNDFGQGWYARAARCTGKYCDSIEFDVCNGDAL